MNCPRCEVPLTVVSGVVEAKLCDQCEGVWLSREALERCLTLQKEYLRCSPLWVTLEADHPDVALEPLICCPECESQMQRYPYGQSQVIVDGCPQHGLWLDDGELAKIYEVHEAEEQAKGKDRRAPAKGAERVRRVSGGVWHGLAEWFKKFRAA